MDKWCSNRLTVIGPEEDLRRFLRSIWGRRLHARHGELMENSPRRFVCVFDTQQPPLAELRSLSRRWPGLSLFLGYEVEAQGIKGLAKAQGGQMHYCQFSYCTRLAGHIELVCPVLLARFQAASAADPSRNRWLALWAINGRQIAWPTPCRKKAGRVRMDLTSPDEASSCFSAPHPQSAAPCHADQNVTSGLFRPSSASA